MQYEDVAAVLPQGRHVRAAQVAEQQGKYLAKQLNASARAERDGKPPPEWPPFRYHHLGSMALVGAPPPRRTLSKALQWRGNPSISLLMCRPDFKRIASPLVCSFKLQWYVADAWQLCAHGSAGSGHVINMGLGSMYSPCASETVAQRGCE